MSLVAIMYYTSVSVHFISIKYNYNDLQAKGSSNTCLDHDQLHHLESFSLKSSSHLCIYIESDFTRWPAASRVNQKT